VIPVEQPAENRTRAGSDERPPDPTWCAADLPVDPEITGITADSRKVKPGFPVRPPWPGLARRWRGVRGEGRWRRAQRPVIADQDLKPFPCRR